MPGTIPDREHNPDETTRTLVVRVEKRVDKLETFGLSLHGSMRDLGNMIIEQKTLLKGIDDKLGEHKGRLTGLHDRLHHVELGRAHDGWVYPMVSKVIVALAAAGVLVLANHWSAPNAKDIAAAIRTSQGGDE